ncbi:MAG TPA: amino acid permease [Pyrinomonadaceae bacterium]|nr:amino acid permease [Pyrinomonadaceae bacterium]
MRTRCVITARVQNKPEEGLVRGIRRWDLVAITINGIIGAGIFGLPSNVYGLIGTYSLIAFVACALVVALIILCFAEVSSRFEATGGPYLYAREAYQPAVAFEIGWLIWLARVTAFAANCNLLINYLSFFWTSATTTAWRASIIVVIVAALALINVLGIRQAAIVSNAFTIGKLVPLIIFIAAGLFFLNPQAFTFGPAPEPGSFSKSVLLLVYAFTGFEMATIPAGEVRDPQRNLPRALIIALFVVAIIYILVQVVCVGTLPGLAQSQKPLADAGSHFLGTAGGAIISAGAVISITGNLNILLLSASRLPFAMAEQNQLPKLLGSIHTRFFTPYIAILITAALMLFLTLKSSFVQALTISTLARLVTYGATCLALPLFRYRSDAQPAAFRLPGGTLIAILALLLIVWLLAHSTLKEAQATAIAAGVGLLIYISYWFYSRSRRPRGRRPSST